MPLILTILLSLIALAVYRRLAPTSKGPMKRRDVIAHRISIVLGILALIGLCVIFLS